MRMGGNNTQHSLKHMPAPRAAIHQVGAIIVAPTRELSRQIFNVAQPYFASVPGLTCQLLVGGT